MKKNNSYLSLKRNIEGIFPHQVASYFLSVINALLNTYLILLMQKLIDSVSTNSDITPILKRFGIVILLFLIETFINQYFFRETTILGSNKVQTILFDKLLNKDISFFSKQQTGALNSLLTNDAENVADWMSSGVLIMLIQSTSFIITLGLMVRYSLIVTSILVVLIVVCFLGTNIVSNSISKATEKSYEIKGEVNQFILESLKTVNVIKVLKKEGYFYNRFSQLVNEKKFKVDRKVAALYAVYISIYAMLSWIVPFVAIGLGVWLTAQGKLTIGTVIALYALVGRLQEPVRILAESISDKKVAMKLADRLNIILNNDRKKEGEREISGFEVLDVNIPSFSYDEKEILKDLNIEIKPSDVLIVKGESGSGKSTLANLIMGILPFDKGNIKINGDNIKSINKSSWWEHALIQGQDQLILEGTLYENLTLGDEYTDNEINEVISIVCLDDFVNEYGLNYKIDESGKNISGGQKQRISLARILLRKPKLLIMDEPTSALDAETSNRLVQNIIEFANENDMALLIISHGDEFDKYATSQLNLAY